jgi:hypothetical protein
MSRPAGFPLVTMLCVVTPLPALRGPAVFLCTEKFTTKNKPVPQAFSDYFWAADHPCGTFLERLPARLCGSARWESRAGKVKMHPQIDTDEHRKPRGL